MEYRDGDRTTISVRYLNKHNTTVKDFFHSSNMMAYTWKHKPNSSSRQPIQGKMKHFGTKKGAGNLKFFEFLPTKWNVGDVNKYHCQANKSANIIAQSLFPEFHKQLKDTMKTLNIEIHNKLGGKQGLCNELLQTQQSFVSEYHVDMDMSQSFSIWSLDPNSNKDTTGWYFVFPFLTCYYRGIEKKGIAVTLKEGTCIRWDGRTIFHCSTSPTNSETNAYGTYFGLTDGK